MKVNVEKLRSRSLAVYQDIADNIDAMPLPDCGKIRKKALEQISKIEQFWPKGKSDG